MKRIAVLIYSLGSGGAERVLSLHLPFLEKEYEVELFLMSDAIHYEVPGGVNVNYLELSDPYESGLKKLLKIPLLALRYKQVCREKGIEISLSFMNRPNYINVLSRCLGSGVKTIVFERAMPSLEYGKGDLKSLINRFLIKMLYKKADRVVCNSQRNRQDLIENFSLSEDIEVLHNPIDIEYIKRMEEEEIEFDFSKFTYVTIGRLDSGKNQKMIIDAFKEVKNRDSQLVIIGEGVLEEELKTYINESDIKERVFLVGKQKNPYKWLKRSHCFVFASRHEGFPNVILEAMACSLPIVSTNPNGVVGEILQEEGVIVDTLEEMVEAMNSVEKKSNYTNRLDEFKLDTIAQKFLKTLQ